jgi:hypothetical protein
MLLATQQTREGLRVPPELQLHKRIADLLSGEQTSIIGYWVQDSSLMYGSVLRVQVMAGNVAAGLQITATFTYQLGGLFAHFSPMEAIRPVDWNISPQCGEHCKHLGYKSVEIRGYVEGGRVFYTYPIDRQDDAQRWHELAMTALSVPWNFLLDESGRDENDWRVEWALHKHYLQRLLSWAEQPSRRVDTRSSSRWVQCTLVTPAGRQLTLTVQRGTSGGIGWSSPWEAEGAEVAIPLRDGSTATLDYPVHGRKEVSTALAGTMLHVLST